MAGEVIHCIGKRNKAMHIFRTVAKTARMCSWYECSQWKINDRKKVLTNCKELPPQVKVRSPHRMSKFKCILILPFFQSLFTQYSNQLDRVEHQEGSKQNTHCYS